MATQAIIDTPISNHPRYEEAVRLMGINVQTVSADATLDSTQQHQNLLLEAEDVQEAPVKPTLESLLEAETTPAEDAINKMDNAELFGHLEADIQPPKLA